MWKWTAALLLLVIAQPALSADFVGTVTAVADGDSFSMNASGEHIKIRLCGVDSPERGHPGFGKSAGELARLIENRQVRCVQVGLRTPCDGRSKSKSRDRYVAQCFIDKRDVAMEMVCAKATKDIERYSGGYYASCKR